jgi:capsule polysaccharide export protein KpsE/RkpR
MSQTGPDQPDITTLVADIAALKQTLAEQEQEIERLRQLAYHVLSLAEAAVVPQPPSSE